MKKLVSLALLTTYMFAYNIEVDVKKCKMRFYDDNQTLIKEYVVATIKPGLPIPNDGYITKVDMNPTWYPTQETKDYFREHQKIILPDVVPAGHPQNYMGPFKISLTNTVNDKGLIYRIHGNIDEKLIGKRASGGCVRMHNAEGAEFAKQIDELLKSGEKIKVHYKA